MKDCNQAGNGRFKSVMVVMMLLSFQPNVFAADYVDPLTSAGTVIGAGLIAEDIVEDLDESIGARIAQAEAAGEYLSSKLYRQLQLLLQGAGEILGDNINLTFDRLSEQQQQFLNTVERITLEIQETRDDILSLEDFIAIDIAVLADSLPFVENDLFPIRSINGYSQIYKAGGNYEITFVGRAFAIRNDVRLTIGDTTLRPGPTTKEYQATFSVPSTVFASLFDDQQVTQITYNLEVYKPRKRGFFSLFGSGDKEPEKVFQHESSILLLPKIPATYELVYVHAGQGWSEEVFSISDTAIAPRTGQSGKWNYNNPVCVSLPDSDGLMIENTANAWVLAGVGAGSWGHWTGGYEFSINNGTGPTRVCRNFAHQIHDQDRTLAMEVSYRKPVTVFGRVPIAFRDPITDEIFDSGLQFGNLYVAQFDEDPLTYYLRIKYFNGQTFTLQKGFGATSGVDLFYNSQQGFNTLSILLGNPYE